ncbi:MAG: transposase [Pirellulaceae bacterium]|nr:transposase [Pirellulaceae bacterium]
MGQSLVKNWVHLTYSTKGRRPWIPEMIQEALWAYQAGIFQQWESPSLMIGGVDDHVHALFTLSKNHALKTIVEQVKKSSSAWIKSDDATRNQRFAWQGGYAAFSVSQSNVPQVQAYIAKQREHHRRLSFEDELRLLFEKHQIEFDERNVWD